MLCCLCKQPTEMFQQGVRECNTFLCGLTGPNCYVICLSDSAAFLLSVRLLRLYQCALFSSMEARSG